MGASDLGRRTVVTSGALAGSLAMVAGAPANARMRSFSQAVADEPLSGVVGLWTRFDSAQGATFRLTQLDPRLRPVATLGAGALALERVGSVVQLQAVARRFAVATVAASWGVPPQECGIDATMIRHLPSSRAVRYLGWTDFI
jgi:hypothetical protein